MTEGEKVGPGAKSASRRRWPIPLALTSPFLLFDHGNANLVSIDACTLGNDETYPVVEKFEVRWWFAELQRLCGVFLTAIGAKEAEIEVSFRGAMNTAKQQKANSLLARAEEEAKLISTRQHARFEPEVGIDRG